MFIGENSFQHPACVCIGSNRHHYHASYGGLLADEDALKKVHNYTGAQGIKICMDCANLVSHTDDDVCPPGLVLLNVTTLEGLDFNTNEDIWEMAEALRDDVRELRDDDADLPPEEPRGLKWSALIGGGLGWSAQIGGGLGWSALIGGGLGWSALIG